MSDERGYVDSANRSLNMQVAESIRKLASCRIRSPRVQVVKENGGRFGSALYHTQIGNRFRIHISEHFSYGYMLTVHVSLMGNWISSSKLVRRKADRTAKRIAAIAWEEISWAYGGK